MQRPCLQPLQMLFLNGLSLAGQVIHTAFQVSPPFLFFFLVFDSNLFQYDYNAAQFRQPGSNVVFKPSNAQTAEFWWARLICV